jgi:signal transduction histidine kinase
MRQALVPSERSAATTPPVSGQLDEDAKRAFLRMISHELRTPLNCIIGFSELLREEICGPLGSPQYKDYASFINDSGHKLLRMVNQIVEIVRLESQAEALNIGPEPLGSAVSDVMQMLSSQAEAWGVPLAAEALDQMPVAAADAKALRTVMINLLQNALAHSPAGEAVRISAWRAGDRALLQIADRGPGFDPAELPRLMRPFEQGQPTMNPVGGGAGLGLPITQLLIEAMSGTLTIRTAPGEGFAALIALPCA